MIAIVAVGGSRCLRAGSGSGAAKRPGGVLRLPLLLVGAAGLSQQANRRRSRGLLPWRLFGFIKTMPRRFDSRGQLGKDLWCLNSDARSSRNDQGRCRAGSRGPHTHSWTGSPRRPSGPTPPRERARSQWRRVSRSTCWLETTTSGGMCAQTLETAIFQRPMCRWTWAAMLRATPAAQHPAQ
jgi:hypothetical protein